MGLSSTQVQSPAVLKKSDGASKIGFVDSKNVTTTVAENLLEQDKFRQSPFRQSFDRSQNYRPKITNDYKNENYFEITDDADETALLSGTTWTNVYYREPSAITLPNGRIIVIATAKYSDDGLQPPDPGQDSDYRCDVIMKRSDDNGETWQNVQRVATQGDVYQNWAGQIAYDPIQDRLWLSYTSYKGQVGSGHAASGYDENTTPIAYVKYSDDQGVSWSVPEDITALIKPATATMAWFPPTSCVVGADGTILFVYSYYDPSLLRINLIQKRADSDVWERVEEIVNENDYSGVGGGETSIFVGRGGKLSALVRTSVSGNTQHRIYERGENNWDYISEFETTSCKAGVFYCEPRLGYNFGKLLVSAPVGITGAFEGRNNPHLFSGYDGTDLGAMPGTGTGAATIMNYSDIVQMYNGAFLCVISGLSAKIRGIVFTPNNITSSNYLRPPKFSEKQINSSQLANITNDVEVGEVVYVKDIKKNVRYNGSAFEDVLANNLEIAQQNISSVVSSINADNGEYVLIQAGANGSSISAINNGNYIGQKLFIYIGSSSATITLVGGVPGASSIQINESSGGLEDISMNTVNKPKFVMLVYLGSSIGWVTDTEANI